MNQDLDDPTGAIWPPTQPQRSALQAPDRTSSLAITSLACGVLGLIPCCGVVPGALAVVFGGISLGPTGRGELRGRGLAIAGLSLGIVSLIFGAVATVLLWKSPDVEPIRGPDLTGDQRRELEDLGVVEPGESVELVYATGMLSLSEGCVVLTDRRIVNYASGTDAWSLAEVASIDFSPTGQWYDDSSFILEREDGAFMRFSVGAMGGGDRLFLRVLTRSVNDARTAIGKEPVADSAAEDLETAGTDGA